MLNKTFHNKPTIKTELQEKVLQFGTGVLLRGLCDYIIDKANKKGIFNGSVVVVKTTGADVSEFTNQDNLYTICVRGIENGKTIEEEVVVESISRVLSTKTHWEEVLKTAENADIQIVVSKDGTGIARLRLNEPRVKVVYTPPPPL
jgi:tagaturonate reductase